ncbi:MAG: hypothetical protein IT451_11895 [Candidatus Brocadia sp.]|nr:hypothetical protein [Candidatus Brocadia sp.]
MNINDMFKDREFELRCKICGNEFVVTREWESKKRVLCGSEKCAREDRRLAMQRYRNTDIGRAAVKKQNLEYKRPDIEKKCEACGEVFKTARKNRYICDKNECQARGNYLRIKKYRESNKDKIRARDVISKKINREESLHRKYCIVCGCNQSEAHHHDYKKPSDVNFLCKTHHNELHSWDSN